MSHEIEAAKSGRAACATCGVKIPKGEVRVAELYQDSQHGAPIYEERYRGDGNYYRTKSDHREAIQRFHHLACAVEKHPSVVRTALNRPFDPALVPDRAKLEKQLEGALEEERKQRVAAATAKLAAPVEAAAGDPNLDPLIAQLADAPEDPELIAIIGDLYQQRNDPRGELIVIQLAQRTAKRERGPEIANPRGRTRTHEVEDPTSKGMVQRWNELVSYLTPRLDGADRSIWGLGFIRRLELGTKSSARIQELAGLWTHPSVRVLSELRLELPPAANDKAVIDHLAQVLPKSLRRLEIGGSHTDGGNLGDLVAALPRLEQLALVQRRADGKLQHASLSKIELQGSAFLESLALLDPARLPAVKELVIREWSHAQDPLATFSRSRWCGVIETLRIEAPVTSTTALAIEGVHALRDALGGRKLARLEISGVPIPLPVRAALGEVTTELVCPAASVVLDDATTHVTHANKPEWGKGKIIKRANGKLEVEFPKDGVKVFKADAPFLVPAD